MKIKKQIKV